MTETTTTEAAVTTEEKKAPVIKTEYRHKDCFVPYSDLEMRTKTTALIAQFDELRNIDNSK